MSNPTAYPLAWPARKPRTKPDARMGGRFNHKVEAFSEYRGRYQQTKELTVSVAVDRVLAELDRLGADRRYPPVISTNLEVRLDGLPRSGQRKPLDPGVAVYFRVDGDPVVLATDRYDSVEANLAAVAAHIAASRAIERHGVGTLKEIFRGFAALPPAMAVDDWRAVLGNPDTLADAEIQYRTRAKDAHPDRGGSDAAMAALNAAIARAREVLS